MVNMIRNIDGKIFKVPEKDVEYQLKNGFRKVKEEVRQTSNKKPSYVNNNKN